MISSDSITGCSKVKATIAAAIAGLFAEEEVVDVRPGAVTVRPFGTDDDGLPLPPVEYRTLGHVVASPGDHALVLRLPFLKLVLGTITIRGVSRPFPIPFGGYHGRYGTEPTAARVDHVHSTEDFVPIAQVWNTYVPIETPNNATPVDIGSQVLNLPKGVWSFNVVAEATMYRSVNTGAVWLSVRMQNDGTRDTDLSETRNTPVANIGEKEPVRVPFARHARIKLDEPGTVTFTVRYRGESTLGTTYAKMVLLTGYVWRVG